MTKVFRPFAEAENAHLCFKVPSNQMDFLRESVYPAIILKSQKYPKRPVTTMSYTKTNKTNHKRRTDPREVRS